MAHPIHHPAHPHYWKAIIALSFVSVVAIGYVVFDHYVVQPVASQVVEDEGTVLLSPTTTKKLPTQEPQLAIYGTCSDTETTQSYSNAGTTTITSYSGQKTSFADTCIDAKTVKEYSCGKNTLIQEKHTCPSRCINGACKGTVYVAHTVDTEARTYGSPTTDFSKTLILDDFATGGLVDKVTDPNGWYRTSYRDSFGNPAKYTWFLLADEEYCNSNLQTCTPVHDAMKPYASRIESNGDQLAYHYHHLGWTVNPGDGTHYYNAFLSMNGKESATGTDIQVAERSLSSVMINHQMYPAFFRSGWAWENTDFSNWLDNVFIFDSSNLSPNYNTVIAEAGVIANVYDWSRATRSWNPYHPSATDYQVPGDLKRWQFRISNQQADFDQAFKQANNGNDVLLTTVTHTYNFGQGLEYEKWLRNYTNQNPGVQFKFVTALEGAQAVLGFQDTTPPSILVTRTGNTFNVTSNEPLYTFPFAAIHTAQGDYRRVQPLVQSGQTNVGLYTWSYSVDSDVLAAATPGTNAPVIVFGGSDRAGNTFITAKISL